VNLGFGGKNCVRKLERDWRPIVVRNRVGINGLEGEIRSYRNRVVIKVELDQLSTRNVSQRQLNFWKIGVRINANI
jgi:hypothetical protein